MATARCYTKSGNVEKYESNCFSGVVNQYPNNFVHHIIGPNSNGNYTITYEGYDDGNSSNYDCYCETIYGADWKHGKGEIKTFYFIKKKLKITFRLSNLFTNGSGTVTCSISEQLPTDIFLTLLMRTVVVVLVFLVIKQIQVRDFLIFPLLVHILVKCLK